MERITFKNGKAKLGADINDVAAFGTLRYRNAADLLRPFDMRSRAGRIHVELYDELCDELGGEGRMTLRQRILASQAASLNLWISDWSQEHFARGPQRCDVSVYVQATKMWLALLRQLGLAHVRNRNADTDAGYLANNYGYDPPSTDPIDDDSSPRRRRVRLSEVDDGDESDGATDFDDS